MRGHTPLFPTMHQEEGNKQGRKVVSLLCQSLSQTVQSIIYLSFGHKLQEKWPSLKVKEKK